MAAAAVNPRLLPGGDVYETAVARGQVPWILSGDTRAAQLRQRLGIKSQPDGTWTWDAAVEQAAAASSTGGQPTEDEIVATAVDLAEVDDLATDPGLTTAAASGAGAAPIVPANSWVTPWGTFAVGTGTVVAVGLIAVTALLLRTRNRE